ncbi:MAG: CAAD domain-containing protein [Microcystaceae cyanobacterium]
MDSNLEKTTEKPITVGSDAPGAISSTTKMPDMNQPWQEWVEPVMDVLGKVPDYVSEFFSSYRQPLITLGLIFLGIVSVKVTLAVLDALDDIPLLAPILQLVGLCYTIWFVYRYLWKASNRAELSTEVEAIKQQIFGND